MCEALREIMSKEFEDAEDKGVDKHLIEQICKKLVKGKSLEIIAEEVEEDVATVEEIVKVAKDYIPDYDVDVIFNALHKNK